VPTPPLGRLRRSGVRDLAYRRLLLLVLGIAAFGCQAAGSPSPSTSPVVTLNRAPTDLACDAAGIPFRSVIFHFDLTGSGVVTAVTDSGEQLATLWSEGFELDQTGKAITDPSGRRVVSDGENLVVPPRDWPRLAGYFVCPAPGRLYILRSDPR
jgi:hypothetical protein